MPNEIQTQLRDTVVSWLIQNNARLASFDRLISNCPGVNTYTQLRDMMAACPETFTTANIKGGLPGLKLVTVAAPLPPEEPAFNSGDLSEFTVQVDSGAPSAPIVITPPVRVLLTPTEAIKALLDKAATSDNSSAAENFAVAAKEGAMAIAILKKEVQIEI